MNKPLAIIVFLAAIMMVVVFPSNAPTAILLCGAASLATLYFINVADESGEVKVFLRQVFIYALLFRVFVAVLTFSFDLHEFFQPDSKAFDLAGVYLSDTWWAYFTGRPAEAVLDTDLAITMANNTGICYAVGGVYFLVGRNMLAVQMLFSALGSATAPLIYLCVVQVYRNRATARLASFMIALFPSLVLWSVQATKDGLMIFLLALTMMLALKLQKTYKTSTLIFLLLAMAGVYFIRPYILIIVAGCVVGGFVIGIQTSLASTIRRLCMISIMAFLISFSGILGSVQDYIEKEGSFETLNRHRSYLASAGDSGFGKEWDVSTPGKALAVLPIGLAYLMLAPFPWEMENIRQALPLPEMVIWWSAIPLMLIGIFYTIKNRFRNAVSLLLFLFLLTSFYSVFQGNVGTAVRQRAQLQVFLLVFVAVGWRFLKEKRENIALLRLNARKVALTRQQARRSGQNPTAPLDVSSIH